MRRQRAGAGRSWKLRIVFVLLGLSVLLGILHVALFGDPKTLGFYLALDVVFVPIQVLLVSIVIERFLSERERESFLHKLNMVIGAFFGEVGNELLGRVFALCESSETLASRLAISAQWTAADYAVAARFADAHRCNFRRDRAELAGLKAFLLAKRSFVLGLLQNPNLLEHDEFTGMIWAVCHLSEELEARPDLMVLPDADVEHLMGDVRRAFTFLVREWLAYMEHLQSAYPYMYSLSVRTNPFRADASPLVYE